MNDPIKKVTEKEVEEKLNQSLKEFHKNLENIEQRFKKKVQEELDKNKRGKS